MTTFDFSPPRRQNNRDSDANRSSYMSNISRYSGISEEAIPITANTQKVSLVRASNESYHTPLSSMSDSYNPQALGSINDIGLLNSTGSPTPYPNIIPEPAHRSSRLKNVYIGEDHYQSGKDDDGSSDNDEDVPLNSPPKGIKNVSNYSSSLNSNDKEDIINSREVSFSSGLDEFSFADTRSNGNRESFFQQHNEHPSDSTNSSAVPQIPHQDEPHQDEVIQNKSPVGLERQDSVIPGSFVFPKETPKSEKHGNQARPLYVYNNPKAQSHHSHGNSKPRSSKPMSPSPFDYYTSNVPAKNLTMASPPPQSSYFSTTNPSGSSAYNNSFNAGETYTSPKDSSAKRRSFISTMEPSDTNVHVGKDPQKVISSTSNSNKGHSRNSSIHNISSLKSSLVNAPQFPVLNVPASLSKDEDPTIPPRSPKRPSPSNTFYGSDMSNDDVPKTEHFRSNNQQQQQQPQQKKRGSVPGGSSDIDSDTESIPIDTTNGNAALFEKGFPDQKSLFTIFAEQNNDDNDNGDNDDDAGTFENEDSVSSFDSKTLFNTWHNSDLRSKTENPKRFNCKQNFSNLRRPNSQTSVASTRELNNELRPPNEDYVILEDLKAREDQITNWINEAKYKSGKKDSKLSLFLLSKNDYRTTLLPRDTSYENSLKSNTSRCPNPKVQDTSFTNKNAPRDSANDNQKPYVPSLRENPRIIANQRSFDSKRHLKDTQVLKHEPLSSLDSAIQQRVSTAETGTVESIWRKSPPALVDLPNVPSMHEGTETASKRSSCSSDSSFSVSRDPRSTLDASYNKTNNNNATADVSQNSKHTLHTPSPLKQYDNYSTNQVPITLDPRASQASLLANNQSALKSVQAPILHSQPEAIEEPSTIDYKSAAEQTSVPVPACSKKSVTFGQFENSENNGVNLSNSTIHEDEYLARASVPQAAYEKEDVSTKGVPSEFLNEAQNIVAQANKEREPEFLTPQPFDRTLTYDQQNFPLTEVVPLNFEEKPVEGEQHKRSDKSKQKNEKGSSVSGNKTDKRRRHRRHQKESADKRLEAFDRKAIKRILDEAKGSFVGPEFAKLPIPSDEKALLEKVIEAISKVTADMMIADQNSVKYYEGIIRLGSALRILEGYPPE